MNLYQAIALELSHLELSKTFKKETVIESEQGAVVRVAGKDEAGEDLLIEASGIDARVLQHEIDHLDGVLMIDRATKEQRREALRILREGPAARDRTPEVSPA